MADQRVSPEAIVPFTDEASPVALYAPSGTSNTRALSVQGVAAGTVIPTQDSADASVAPGTAPSKAIIAGGQFNTVQPSFTNGQTGALQLDSVGNLRAVLGTSGATIGKVDILGNAGATLDSTIGAGTAPTNQIVVGSVFNSSAPAPTTGQAMALQADQAGNLRNFPGIDLAALSAWNSSTALNTTQNIFTNSGAPAVLVQLDQTTTITAGAITFEITFDGTNWIAIPGDAVLDPTNSSLIMISLPYTLQANTNKPFLIQNVGWQGLRIKLSTQITGTGTVTPNYALLGYSPITTSDIAQIGGSVFTLGLGTVGSSLPVVTTKGTTSTLSNVAGSASSVTILAANTNRIRATVFNDSTSAAYIKEGSAASTSSFTWKLQPTETLIVDDYNGILTGLWDTATGNARVTEVTP